jgi:hypothetical protein
MSAEPQRTCPSCGNELSGATEFCPVCMLRKALADGVESGESSASEDTVKLTPEQAVQRFEHYELVTGEDGKPVELGRGAMGVTYKAVDVDLRCPVALKVISERNLGDESARLRFLREARAAARLRHSNVASVLHLGRTGSSYFYAMEFVEGKTLENLIKRSGQLEVKLALEIATQVAAGLAAVHKQELVHRDIKPSNIMVPLGTIHRGWARSASGDTAEGIPCIEQGIRGFRATGTVLGLPSHLARKAEALHLADRTSEALETINEAQALAERFEQPNWCAELHRLRGVFLAAMGADEPQIEASFCAAIRIAREQKSVSLEKRAEATYAEYRRQKASAPGGRGFRLALC